MKDCRRSRGRNRLACNRATTKETWERRAVVDKFEVEVEVEVEVEIDGEERRRDRGSWAGRAWVVGRGSSGCLEA